MQYNIVYTVLPHMKTSKQFTSNLHPLEFARYKQLGGWLTGAGGHRRLNHVCCCARKHVEN